MVNILKHMEAAFVVSATIFGSAAFVTERLPEASARPYPAATASVAASGTPMATVYITAKRMTAEEKRQSLLEERRSAAADRT